MGLNIRIKGLETEDTYNDGYIKFDEYRMRIVKAFNKKLAKIYEKGYLNFNYKMTDNEIKRWNNLCNDDLDIFLWHSDCDGKLTPQECKKIFNVLKNLIVEDFKYNDKWTMHQLWLNMFEYCYKHKVNMYFY